MVHEVGGRAHVDARAEGRGRISSEMDMLQVRAAAERGLPHIKKPFANAHLLECEAVAERIAADVLERIRQDYALKVRASEECGHSDRFHAFLHHDVPESRHSPESVRGDIPHRRLHDKGRDRAEINTPEAFGTGHAKDAIMERAGNTSKISDDMMRILVTANASLAVLLAVVLVIVIMRLILGKRQKEAPKTAAK